MIYKDLIYKITSGTAAVPSPVKKKIRQVNDAKKSVQNTDILIGVIIDENTVLNKGITTAFRIEVERTLTVLFNSPISDSFSFLPLDKTSLISMLDLFPDRSHHFISDSTEVYAELQELKKSKLNLQTISRTENVNADFVSKIDYLVTVNVDDIEPTMNAKLVANNVMILPMEFRGTTTLTQKEKTITPDPSGWAYNPASGTWMKTWGKDGSQTITGWKAPDDWNLPVEPEMNVTNSGMEQKHLD